jgi:hypothetical protein
MNPTVDIHRLLDEAFLGIEMTPDVQDLKEEMRADLMARVEELEQAGQSPEAAARQALRQLGDVRAVLEEMKTASPGPSRPWVRARVRPRPAFVLRTVLLSAVILAGLAVAVLGGFDRGVSLAGQAIAATAVALATGLIVADSLRQETTGSYPLPRARAVGYGGAGVIAVAALGTGALYLRDHRLPWAIAGVLAALAAILLFTYLGVTQTNRHKPWVVRQQAVYEEEPDRFTRDPAAAARFGIYTVTIWILTLTAFAVLSFTVGWAWSWLALVAGLVVFMVTLARMLFVPPER